MYFKKLLQLKLKILSKIILAKYKPEIIGITGSLGKTSARDAIAAVLSSKFNIRSSIKNYNNEIGLPLTIIGTQIPKNFIFGWSKVIFKALKIILIRDKNYPKILVLEMGVDRIGDMDYLLNIVKPKIGVVTNISESHLEFFKNIKIIAKEKGKLVQALPQSGWAVFNQNEKEVLRMKQLNEKIKILTYGFSPKSKIRASNINLNYDEDGTLNGINFALTYNNQKYKSTIAGAVGDPIVQAALAGASLGIIYGLDIKEISQALHKFKVTKPGRATIVHGIKNTLIIDDAYNSSPKSCVEAINTLSSIKIKKEAMRWAVLGDMLELGAYTEEGHKKVGEQVAKLKINQLIVIGERARNIASAAKNVGMKEYNINHFSSNERAGRFLQERIKQGDIILVKGSRGMKMEEIVEEIRSIKNEELRMKS